MSDDHDARRSSGDIATSQPDILDYALRFVLSYWRWSALALVGIIAASFQWCWVGDPPGRIHVLILGLPDDVSFVCVSTDRAGEVELLHWYPRGQRRWICVSSHSAASRES